MLPRILGSMANPCITSRGSNVRVISFRIFNLSTFSLGFTVQSIEGTERVFQRNLTLGKINFIILKVTANLHDSEGYTEALTLQTYASGNSHGAALLHILGTDAKHGSENVTAQIKLGPLRCEERIVENVDCLFEINEKPDWIKVSGISQGKVKFAFRTDQPEGPFLRVTADNGSFIQMDLLDGKCIRCCTVRLLYRFLGCWFLFLSRQ